jgi:hypothetical protein
LRACEKAQPNEALHSPKNTGVRSEKRLNKRLANLSSRKKITKNAHAGRGHEIKWEIPVNIIMKLKTITMLAAIGQLLALFCLIAQMIRSLVQLANGGSKWEYEWMYILSMPVFLFSGIMLTVFLFTLAVKQKDN